MKKKTTKTAQIVNRRAGYDYELGEELVVGMQLSGKEVRAARDGRVQLKGSFITIRNGELWLNNTSFNIKNNEPYTEKNSIDSTPKKLLANKKEILKLQENKQAGYSIIPKKMLTGGRFIKLVIAPGKGKKQYDKRETIKRRQQDRESKRMLGKY